MNDDPISRQAALDAVTDELDIIDHVPQWVFDRLEKRLKQLPSAQPTEASCWGCNCPKMERLKEQKTFSEMVHLHDVETHDKRTETHGVCFDTISRQAAIELVKDVCDAIMSGCESWYDPETKDEVYEDIREVNAILKCNKEVRIALRNLPSTQPGEDIRAMCGECDAWNQYKNYPQPRWIPISEKLPKDDTEVIVSCTDDSGDYEISYVTTGWHYKGLWVVNNDRCYFVKAWQPLPEKPWEGR